MSFPIFLGITILLSKRLPHPEMSPEELDFLKKLAEYVLEIKTMFKRFTADRKQQWKDEQVRLSRRGVGKMTPRRFQNEHC